MNSMGPAILFLVHIILDTPKNFPFFISYFTTTKNSLQTNTLNNVIKSNFEFQANPCHQPHGHMNQWIGLQLRNTSSMSNPNAST